MKTFLKILIGSLISYLLMIHFIFRWVCIDGNSMNPTLKNNQHCLLEYYLPNSKPKVGDIVIFKDPLTLWLGKENQGYCAKRVIATENQTVSMTNGWVYVDGKMITEMYLLNKNRTKTYISSAKNPAAGVSFVCGLNEYFVMGDNRGDSGQQRRFR
jgi:signal peptidase I